LTQILLGFVAKLLSGYMNTFARILPLIYCQMSADFVIYLLAFCRHYLMNQILFLLNLYSNSVLIYPSCQNL